ncbi:hypothetical protein [Nocardioides bigeumensis]|uniref:hypothetical protein n=1 Tax=Nocardioides bigeumensis TaxID=433657 RepID=UPI0031E15011
MRLHHVQVAMPPGGEAEARRFYAEGLGLRSMSASRSRSPRLARRIPRWSSPTQRRSM